MNRYLLLAVFILMLCIAGQAQTSANFKIMNQYTNDMVYDSVSSKILISIPSTDNIHGNSIGYVDPTNAVLTNSYFIGSEPNPLSLTESRKYLYVGLDGASKVKKFNISTHMSELTFSVGYNSTFGTFRANNISCKPGSDTDVAISRISGGNAMGVAIYSNAVKYNDTISYYPRTPDLVHFDTSSQLYGYENSSSGYNFFTMAVKPTGVSILNNLGYLFSGFSIDFYVHKGMALSDNGTLLDLTGGSPSLMGVYKIPTESGYGKIKACFDPYKNLVCFAMKGFWDNNIYIYRFNLNTFLKQDEIQISGVTGDVLKLINWGSESKYALSTKDGKLVIINGTFVTDTRTLKNENLSVYPNPATDQITIHSHEKSKLEILNSEGKCVKIMIADQNNTTIDVSDLSKGIYFVKTQIDNEVLTTKFIKR